MMVQSPVRGMPSAVRCEGRYWLVGAGVPLTHTDDPALPSLQLCVKRPMGLKFDVKQL